MMIYWHGLNCFQAVNYNVFGHIMLIYLHRQHGIWLIWCKIERDEIYSDYPDIFSKEHQTWELCPLVPHRKTYFWPDMWKVNKFPRPRNWIFHKYMQFTSLVDIITFDWNNQTNQYNSHLFVVLQKVYQSIQLWLCIFIFHIYLNVAKIWNSALKIRQVQKSKKFSNAYGVCLKCCIFGWRSP